MVLEQEADGTQVHSGCSKASGKHVCGIAFNKASSLLATVDNGCNSTLGLWDTDSGDLVTTKPAQHIYGLPGGGGEGSYRFTACVFSECGRYVYAAVTVESDAEGAAGGGDGEGCAGFIVVYDVKAGLKQTRCVVGVVGVCA